MDVLIHKAFKFDFFLDSRIATWKIGNIYFFPRGTHQLRVKLQLKSKIGIAFSKFRTEPNLLVFLFSYFLSTKCWIQSWKVLGPLHSQISSWIKLVALPIPWYSLIAGDVSLFHHGSSGIFWCSFDCCLARNICEGLKDRRFSLLAGKDTTGKIGLHI